LCASVAIPFLQRTSTDVLNVTTLRQIPRFIISVSIPVACFHFPNLQKQETKEVKVMMAGDIL